MKINIKVGEKNSLLEDISVKIRELVADAQLDTLVEESVLLSRISNDLKSLANGIVTLYSNVRVKYIEDLFLGNDVSVYNTEKIDAQEASFETRSPKDVLGFFKETTEKANKLAEEKNLAQLSALYSAVLYTAEVSEVSAKTTERILTTLLDNSLVSKYIETKNKICSKLLSWRIFDRFRI